MSADPGWNDPPKISPFAAQPTGIGKKLNKRVPFPGLGGGQAVPTQPKTTTTTTSLPGPPPSTIKPPLSSKEETKETIPDEKPSLDRTEIQKFAFNALDELISTNKSDVTEVKRRIESLQQSWKEGLFEEGLEDKLYILTKAMQEKDYDKALSVHRTIVFEYANQAKTWCPALRHLIIDQMPQQQPLDFANVDN